MGAEIPKQKTTLSCEITGTVAGGILWWRPNNGTPQMIFSCNDECHLYPGYSVVIDPATQKHTLTNDSFDTTLDAQTGPASLLPAKERLKLLSIF